MIRTTCVLLAFLLSVGVGVCSAEGITSSYARSFLHDDDIELLA